MNYYLGIDVSKGYADLVLLDEHKTVVEKNFQLDDTFQGHHLLFIFVQDFFSTYPDATLYAAVESTGGYENNWLNTLQNFQAHFNIFAGRLNPKGVHHHSIAGMNRIITDRVSARTIAEYLITHPEKVSFEKNDDYASLRSQWKYIQMLTKQKGQLLNQLEKILYRAHPELMIYWKQGLPNWMLQLLVLYPTAQRLSETSVEQVAQIPYISAVKSRSLTEKAKTSIASANDPFVENIITSLAQEILHKQKLIDRQTQLMISHCHLPAVKLLETIKAVGTYSAIGLILEIGAVSRFPSVKKLASFFGLHPKYKQSGDGIWEMKMSKEGRSQPRKILFMVTMVAVQHNPLIREVYERNLKKGKCRMDALGVCMHKILRIVYGMLKTRTPFDPDIDRKNQKKNVPRRKEAVDQKLRRYQKPDPDAPISYRHSKKRKEQNQSQGDPVTQHEIKVPTLSSSDT
jgi:transposase